MDAIRIKIQFIRDNAMDDNAKGGPIQFCELLTVTRCVIENFKH